MKPARYFRVFHWGVRVPVYIFAEAPELWRNGRQFGNEFLTLVWLATCHCWKVEQAIAHLTLITPVVSGGFLALRHD